VRKIHARSVPLFVDRHVQSIEGGLNGTDWPAKTNHKVSPGILIATRTYCTGRTFKRQSVQCGGYISAQKQARAKLQCLGKYGFIGIGGLASPSLKMDIKTAIVKAINDPSINVATDDEMPFPDNFPSPGDANKFNGSSVNNIVSRLSPMGGVHRPDWQGMEAPRPFHRLRTVVAPQFPGKQL